MAAVVKESELTRARQAMRSLCLPGQSRLHFTKEHARRRREIAAAINGLDLAIEVYDATGIADPHAARTACLRRLVADLAAAGSRRLTIERDASLVRRDQQVLYAAVRDMGCADTLAYDHLAARGEPLLWVADAAAWCWTHGPTWRARIQPLVRTVTRL